MVFEIKYQTKADAADPHIHFTHRFYAEHPTDPTLDMVRELVNRVSNVMTNGDFDENSIEIQMQADLDAEEIKREERIVYKFI